MKSITKFRLLNEVCQISNGYAFKSEDFLESGVPLLRISNINDEKVTFRDNTVYLDKSNLDKYKNFIVRRGDVVIALSGATTGKYGIYQSDIPCLLNQRIGIIRNESSTVLNSKYFYFYLGTLKSEILRKAQGAAQPNISTKDLGKMCIPLPPLAEQKQIAAILDTADSLRQKDQQLVEHYTALSQSLFLGMFGDPASNPMEWVISSLKSLTTKIGSGATPRGGKNAYRNDGVSLIRSLNIHDNRFLMKELAHINDEQASDLSNVIVENQDVLLNITGASVCRCAIVPFDVLPARVNQHVCIIRTDKSKLNPLYLLHLMISARFKQKILAVAGAGGATREALTKKDVEDLYILLPPIELQNQFAERAALIEQQKQQAQTNLQNSEVLFNSLLQRAFTGELTADKAA